MPRSSFVYLVNGHHGSIDFSCISVHLGKTMRKGWNNWACLAWRREASGETSLQPFRPLKRVYKKDGDRHLVELVVIKQGVNLRHFLWWAWWNLGTDCPERWWVLCFWKHARSGGIGLWAIWSGWRCPCSLQGSCTRWPLKIPSSSNYSMISAGWIASVFYNGSPETEELLGSIF